MRISHCLAAAIALSLTAAPAFAATRSAVELSDVAPSRSTPVVFVDALKQSTPWHSATPLATTVDGDVTSLARGQVAERTVYAAGQSRPDGDYTLLYDGRGTFAVDGATIDGRRQGRITVRVSPMSDALVLRLTGTDAADPVRDVRLILPGFEATYAARPFYPPFVESLAGADVLRFAHWSHAATLATSQVWPLRPRVSHVTQADDAGVAPEYAIALANQTGADPWFALPMGATDAYVYGVADLVHRFLDPRLRPTFEYGDRVWDQTSGANAYARMAAHNVGIQGDPSSAASGWYARRSVEIFSIVDRVFGADAGRVDRVTSSDGVARSTDGAIVWRQIGADRWSGDTAGSRTRVAPSQTFVFAVGEDTTPVRDRNGRPPLALHIMPALSARVQAPALSAGRTLAGSLGEPLDSVDVSSEGSIDWVAADGANGLERKATGANAIAVSLGGGRIARAPAGFSTLEWSDGRSARAGSLSSGVAIGTGGALHLWAPADRTPRVLRIYAGASSARASLSASVEGASYVDSSLAAVRGRREGVYTLVYRADTVGRIAVTFAPAAAAGPNAFVSFRGATLAPYLGATNHPADETTYHNGAERFGWDQDESTLNTTNVAGQFGLIRTLQVDGNVLAQPLYLSDYRITGRHNVVIVATEHDSIYEFDADTGAQLIKVNFGKSQSSTDVGCLDIRPEYGITSTPVIDRFTHTLYVVTATEPTAFEFHTTLHALDIATLTDKVPPVEIAASETISNGSTLSFDPQNQMSRTSLALSKSSIYVGIGSHCDSNAGAISGWILRYDFSLNKIGQFATVEDSTGYLLSSVWMTGFAPAIDPHGNLFVVTGNGAFDHDRGGKNFGESVLRVRPDLSKVTDYFTPANWQTLNNGDTDFGSGGIMLLPPQQGTVPDVAVANGKFSTLYLLDRDHLGALRTGDAGALQHIPNTGGGVWGGPAYYNGPTGQFVYYQAGGAPLLAYALGQDVNGIPMLTLSSTGSSTAGYGGSLPVVSSNGQQPGTGIVWLVKRSSPLLLEAYDATDVSKKLFSAPAGSWGNPQHNGFVTPLVAAGKVYVPSTGAVSVFGIGGSRAFAAHPASSPVATIHQIHGFIVAVAADTITLRLRDGRLARIDIRQARAARHTGMLPIGGAVVAYGPIDRTGVFRATSIGHTSADPKDWTPDE